jgi:CHAD domain-containing protein
MTQSINEKRKPGLPGNCDLDEGAAGELRAVACKFLGEANRWKTAFLKNGGAEELHRYRVCLRRARVAMGIGKWVLVAELVEPCRKALAAAMKSSNRLRDLDVKCAVFPRIMKSLPKSLEPGVDVLLGLLQGERNREAASVRSELEKLEVSRLVDGVGGVASSGGVTLRGVVRKRAVKLARGIVRLSDRLRPSSAESKWHEIRIEGKKLRYLLEVFGGFFPKRTVGRVVGSLERLQAALGELNDNAMQAAFLSDPLWERSECAGRRVSMCLGGMAVLLDQRGEILRRKALVALAKFRKDGAGILKGLK